MNPSTRGFSVCRRLDDQRLRCLIHASWWLLFPLAAWGQSLEIYDNFNTLGVIVEIPGASDPDEDATAVLSYAPAGGILQAGFPLTRVSSERFVCSLFWLQPGTSYDVRVDFVDPDADPIDGVILQGSQSTRPALTIPEPLHVLVVSPVGSGTACTDAVPCDLSEALSRVQPGSQILMKGGVYYHGGLTFPASGQPDHPIVIRSAPGETAILDGADPDVFAWAGQGNGVFLAQVHVGNPHIVIADGERLFPYSSLSDLVDLVYGLSGFFASDTSVYVKFMDSSDPSSKTMAVSRFNDAFSLGQDHVFFVDLQFRYYGQGSWAKAIYLNNANHCLIRNCVFEINDTGVGLKRVSHRNTIEDCEFFDTKFLWPWDAVKTEGGLEGGGIAFYSPMSGRGTVIRRNVFHDYFDGFGGCANDNGDLTNETDIHDNLVYRAGDDGLSTDGSCSNLRIWHNEFRDVLVGVSLAPAMEGPTYAIRNLIHRTGAGNSQYSGYPFKFNFSGLPPSGRMYLFHNTADAFHPGNNGFYIKAPGEWEEIVTRNNIWVGTNYALYNYNTSQAVNMDGDDVWCEGCDHLIRWDGVNYDDLSSFSSSVGQLSGGVNLYPGFVDSAGWDYTLISTSQMIDRGVLIPGINDGYSGAAPDLGWWEWVDQDMDFSTWRCAQGEPCHAPGLDFDGDGVLTVLDFVYGM